MSICDRPCFFCAILEGELNCLRSGRIQPDSETACKGFKTPAEAAEEAESFQENQLNLEGKCKTCNQ
ncbi:hypothetical protein LCGC14_2538870 [marine sediment metagenome]|uniref:Uncharacterized protein n=1 Tax=marine sediment metagenome TaxID=412755 RepID=A0A0F9D2U6_9ZZZZ